MGQKNGGRKPREEANVTVQTNDPKYQSVSWGQEWVVREQV